MKYNVEYKAKYIVEYNLKCNVDMWNVMYCGYNVIWICGMYSGYKVECNVIRKRTENICLNRITIMVCTYY